MSSVSSVSNGGLSSLINEYLEDDSLVGYYAV